MVCSATVLAALSVTSSEVKQQNKLTSSTKRVPDGCAAVPDVLNMGIPGNKETSAGLPPTYPPVPIREMIFGF